MRPALVVIFAYLLGSIPFGFMIVRATQGADVRETGSGGTGATNVTRRAGRGAGVLTLILDAGKGAVAVLVARWFLGRGSYGQSQEMVSWWIGAAAIAVILGHMFPIWLRFRGGKGVATGLGVFLTLAPLAVAVGAVVFLLVVWQTRYVSLGSMLAAAAIPVVVIVKKLVVGSTDPAMPTITAALIGAALIVFAHRANIGRLMRGTESKFK